MSTRVANYGQIKQMSVPDGWLEYDRVADASSPFYLREYTHPENPEVKIAFYYRGRRISDTTAGYFHGVLEGEPHDLTQDELLDIDLVLRNMAEEEAFEREYARTDDLNGKRVLTVRGRWNKSGLISLGIFVDAERNGEVVQEIYFSAPDTVYERYAELAMNALKSIEWK